MNRSH